MTDTSNYYLCETCALSNGCPDRERVCWYKYCDCRVCGDMRMLVVHDGAERPADVCEHYVEGEERHGR